MVLTFISFFLLRSAAVSLSCPQYISSHRGLSVGCPPPLLFLLFCFIQVVARLRSAAVSVFSRPHSQWRARLAPFTWSVSFVFFSFDPVFLFRLFGGFDFISFFLHSASWPLSAQHGLSVIRFSSLRSAAVSASCLQYQYISYRGLSVGRPPIFFFFVFLFSLPWRVQSQALIFWAAFCSLSCHSVRLPMVFPCFVFLSRRRQAVSRPPVGRTSLHFVVTRSARVAPLSVFFFQRCGRSRSRALRLLLVVMSFVYS
jgi:hypothetical protein